MTSLIDGTVTPPESMSPDLIAYFGINPNKPQSFYDEVTFSCDEYTTDYDTIERAMKARFKYLPDSPVSWKKFMELGTNYGGLEAFLQYIGNEGHGFIFCLQGLPALDGVIMTHKNNPLFLHQLQDWVTWYYQNKFDMMIVNYGPYHFTPLVNVRQFFSAFWTYLHTDATQLSQSFLSHASPAWFGFVKWLKEKYGVNILPNQQQIQDGRAIYNAVERVYKAEHGADTVQRPKEYFLWGFRSKFLWDLEHIPLFRQLQFKLDAELERKYVEFGGVGDAFIEWIRDR